LGIHISIILIGLQINIENELFVYNFYCERNIHSNLYLYREIELIITKLILAFGIDDYQKGIYDFKENKEIKSNAAIRKWTKGELIFSLSVADWPSGNFIILSMYTSSHINDGHRFLNPLIVGNVQ
jgi:hypothetical protein